MSRLFAQIRRACAALSERAAWVHIDETGLADLADRLAQEAFEPEVYDPAHPDEIRKGLDEFEDIWTVRSR